MKRSKEEALRWLKQAEYDLEAAKRNFDQKIYSYVCFKCKQSAQKALKSFPYFKGDQYIRENSIHKLSEKYDKEIRDTFLFIFH